MRRLIDGPAADWLSAREVAQWLHIGATLLKELRDAGDFPRPVPFGRRKAQRWYWLDVVAWAHLRSLDRPAPAAGGASGRRRPAAE